MTDTRLAFVDVETTGLDPMVNRIAEIGVVTVDGTAVDEWTTFVAATRGGPARRPRSPDPRIDPTGITAPSFKDVATDLARRLDGRLLVAHNARFDYAFLKAEFQRAGREFHARTLCTVMLSRKLYPQHADHDLDALMTRHRLGPSDRHRALPDARLLWQFWQAISRERDGAILAAAIAALLAGPVLPAHLDPTLIDRLPDAPGVYTLRDAEGATLHVGEARNLRAHLIGYFRLDRASAKAVATAHRVKGISWRVTGGMLGARLLRIALRGAKPASRRSAARAFSWKLAPDGYPVVHLEMLGDGSHSSPGEHFGMFETERKARNALRQLAAQHSLCHALLGIPDDAGSACLACPANGNNRPCTGNGERLKQLVKSYSALRTHRVAAWPFRGPVGVREGTDLHVFDQWRYLGTATNDGELHETLDRVPGEFDREMFEFLGRALPRLSRKRLVDLHGFGGHLAGDTAASTQSPVADFPCNRLPSIGDSAASC